MARADRTTEQTYLAAMASFQAGDFDGAERSFRQVLGAVPNHAPSLQVIGLIFHRRGRYDEAVAWMTRSLQISPQACEFWRNIALPLSALGRQPEAIAACRRSVRVEPNFSDGWFALSQLCIESQQLHEAAGALQRVIQLTPNNLAARRDFGWLMEHANHQDEALEQYDQIIAANPKDPKAHLHRGTVLNHLARTSEALASLRQAVDLGRESSPEQHEYLSALLFVMHFDGNRTAADLLGAHREWEERFGAPLQAVIQPHTNDRSHDRKLRVGFLSPDLRGHVVGWNLAPLLRHRDDAVIRTFCYSTSDQPDSFSDSLRRLADDWIDLRAMNDEQAAARIRADGIDVLVDLSLHSSRNRLTIFARKPAPVQISYLGYCSTTGLSAMDARLSDAQFDPPDSDLNVYAERTIRLSHSYWCYEPGISAPEVGESPFERNGFITFGCMNSPSKLSRELIDSWTTLLVCLPDARLILTASPGSQTTEIVATFRARGVDESRIEFFGKEPIEQYFATYNRIDIALDVYPFSGGITSCDAVWMGVPLVTLSGKTSVGRGGASVLAAIGLPELIAFNESDYLDVAIALAKDRPRLRELRATLRDRVQRSPLRNAEQFAKDFEAACRTCWIRWCDDQQ